MSFRLCRNAEKGEAMSYLERLRQIELERAAPPSPERWLATFQEIAALTNGLTVHDIRFLPLMSLIDACEAHYVRDDWSAFQQSGSVARQVAQLSLGTLVRWQSTNGMQQGTVEALMCDERGHVWVVTEFGLFRLELLLTVEH